MFYRITESDTLLWLQYCLKVFFFAFVQCNVLLKHYDWNTDCFIWHNTAGMCVWWGNCFIHGKNQCETTMSSILSGEHLFKWEEEFLIASYGLKTSNGFCLTDCFCYLLGNCMFICVYLLSANYVLLREIESNQTCINIHWQRLVCYLV